MQKHSAICLWHFSNSIYSATKWKVCIWQFYILGVLPDDFLFTAKLCFVCCGGAHLMYNFKELELLYSALIPHCGGVHFHTVQRTTKHLQGIWDSPTTPVPMVEAKPYVKQLFLELCLI